MAPSHTTWVFGDQLDRHLGALAAATPATHRVLIIESRQKIESRRWHVQRAHLLVASMRRFAEQLRNEGFEVDYRIATSMRVGFLEHCAQFAPTIIQATEPNSRTARALVSDLGVQQVASQQFLCHPTQFAEFMATRKSFKMEDFYRWQRRRLGYLMDGDEPAEGRWNFDEFNREPPPKPGTVTWSSPVVSELDHLDAEVLNDISATTFGEQPVGLWPTSRTEALKRLDHFVDNVLSSFGPHEDAMVSHNWHLAHSMLSPALNIGLLHPREVCDRVEAAYRAGVIPIQSAEGFIRQIIGWREFVWNLYWSQPAEYAQMNSLEATMPLPPAFTNPQLTQMNCVRSIVGDINDRGWVHHIPRLMVLGNLALIAGINPQEFTQWMWDSFVDAAEWVMVPNVVGMSLFADGGILATKPYAAGGAYIDRMSDYCKPCAFNRKNRVGDDACPFTTLYWDFLLRHNERFVRNPRIATQVRAAQKLKDADEVRARAHEVLERLQSGTL
jgi:deoxyribodipyrimidine photolyase-related protein